MLYCGFHRFERHDVEFKKKKKGSYFLYEIQVSNYTVEHEMVKVVHKRGHVLIESEGLN